MFVCSMPGPPPPGMQMPQQNCVPQQPPPPGASMPMMPNQFPPQGPIQQPPPQPMPPQMIPPQQQMPQGPMPMMPMPGGPMPPNFRGPAPPGPQMGKWRVSVDRCIISGTSRLSLKLSNYYLCFHTNFKQCLLIIDITLILWLYLQVCIYICVYIYICHLL